MSREEEIFETVNRIFPELMELLREKHPELIPLYTARFEYTSKKYPMQMRLHNAIQILRTYLQLKK